MPDYQKFKIGKGQGKIKIPFKKADAELGGITIFSAIDTPNSSILSSVKSAPPDANKKAFLMKIASLLGENLRAQGWRSGFIILAPQSSSKFVLELIDALQTQFSGTTNLGMAFRKGKRGEVLVRSEAKGITPKIEHELNQAIERQFRNSGTIEAKKFHKRDLKFIDGLMIYQAPKNLNGANVMIVDDVVSSGATMAAIYHELKSMGANRIVGVTALRSAR